MSVVINWFRINMERKDEKVIKRNLAIEIGLRNPALGMNGFSRGLWSVTEIKVNTGKNNRMSKYMSQAVNNSPWLNMKIRHIVPDKQTKRDISII